MIRKATVRDMPDLLRMGELFINEAPYSVPYDEETCLTEYSKVLLDDGSNKWLAVAEEDGQVVGMIAGLRVPFFYNKNHYQAMEWFWWVDKEYRKIGIGDQLKVAYEDWAMSLNVVHMSVSTMSTNKTLIDKYIKDGYTLSEFSFIKEAA